MIWWRIELDKDGSIKSCEQVEANRKDTRFVRFVEAPTKAEACSTVKRWYAERCRKRRENSAKRRADHIARGLCYECGKRPHAPDRSRCGPCLKRAVVNTQRCQAGETTPRHHDATIARARAHYSKNLFTILNKFDALGPVAFRKWLVDTLNAKGAQVT